MPDESSKKVYRIFRLRLDGDDLGFLGGNWINDLRERRRAEQRDADNRADEDTPGTDEEPPTE